MKDACDDVLKQERWYCSAGTLTNRTLEEPEIIKQGGRYGNCLKVAALSIQMMRTNITTEITPMDWL